MDAGPLDDASARGKSGTRNDAGACGDAEARDAGTDRRSDSSAPERNSDNSTERSSSGGSGGSGGSGATGCTTGASGGESTGSDVGGGDGDNQRPSNNIDCNCKCSGDLLTRLVAMEERMRKIEEEGKAMRGEIWGLRDKLEEEEFSKRRMEEKTKNLEEEATSLREAVEREKVEIERKVKELEERERRISSRNGQEGARSTRRCVVITDSNGRGATSDSIKNHLPRNERDSFHIEVAVAYTTVAAINQVDRKHLDVRGATVVIDNLTNDARDTQARPAMTPLELVRSVDQLRQKLRAAGAKAVIVCQIKPMQVTDVTPYNNAISEFLRAEQQRGRGGFGCQTQIRLNFLKSDGFHVQPMYDSTIDRTYACAIMGVPVPCPTPSDQFVPDRVRRRWETEWPRISEGQGRSMNHV